MPRSITLGCLHRGAGQNRRLVVLSERSLLSRPVFSVLAARLRSATAAIPAEKRYCLMRRVLNATPCVFPILLLKLLSLARQAHGHPSVKLDHGLAYTA